MNLIEDAGKIVRHAWSMRFIYASVLFGAIDGALPYFAPEHRSPAFGILASVCAMAAGVSRVISQPKLKGE